MQKSRDNFYEQTNFYEIPGASKLNEDFKFFFIKGPKHVFQGMFLSFSARANVIFNYIIFTFTI